MNIDDRHVIPAPIEQTHTIKLPVVLTRDAILKETLVDRERSGGEKTGHDSSDVSLLKSPNAVKLMCLENTLLVQGEFF